MLDYTGAQNLTAAGTGLVIKISGTLYICGTPIGNLSDMTLRALETLKTVDCIACEDTRHTLKLLNHYGIKKELLSYHEHNKTVKGAYIIECLRQGKNIALVSDAGMPGISDPGEEIIRLCQENQIPVTACPGPTALITALVLSGLSTGRYVFEGFLPKDKKSRKKRLEELISETRTVVFYESPHAIAETLRLLETLVPERKMSLARELTKKHEEIQKGSVSELAKYYSEHQPRGEFVVVMEGCPPEDLEKQDDKKWDEISLTEHLELHLREGLTKNEAIKLVAKERGLNKRELYREFTVKEE